MANKQMSGGMCLSAIGAGDNLNPTLNRHKNTGVPIGDVSNVLDTCPLINYGESNGARCGSCCFEQIEDPCLIGALVLHNCETGEILDFQCPPMGLSCPEDGECSGNVLVEMECWELNPHCQQDEEPSISFDICEDACSICVKLEHLLLINATGYLVSWRNGPKSETHRFDKDCVMDLLRIYQGRCRPRCGFRFQPDC